MDGTSVGVSVRKMSPEAFTSSKSKSTSIDIGEISSLDQTVSENQEKSSGKDESDEETTQKETQQEKKMKISSKTLAESYPIDEMKYSTTKCDLDKLKRFYNILDDVILRVPSPKDTSCHTLERQIGSLGVRLPLQPYFVRVLERISLSPCQLNSNG